MSETQDRDRRRAFTGATSALVVAIALVSSVNVAMATIESQVAYARGLVAYSGAAWDAAFDDFDAAVAADPQDALALYYRGLTQARRGNYDAAAGDIRAALRFEPLLPGAALDLGVVLFNQGRFADAKRPLEAALERPNERSAAAFFLGLSAYRLGEHQSALRWFDEAAGDPSLQQVSLYYSGLASLREGDPEGARRRLVDAVAVAPDSEIGQRAAGIDVRAPEAELVRRSTPRALRPWSVHASARLELDSNVNAGQSSGPAGTSSEGDGRPVVQVGGRYRIYSGDAGSLVAGADLGQSIHFDQRAFDLTGVRLRLDWTSRPDRWRYGGVVGYEYFGLDYSGFSQALQLLPWLAYQWTEETTTQAYYRFRYRDYLSTPFDPFRDGYNNALGLRQYWAPIPGLIVHGGYQIDMESPEDTGSSDPWIASGAEDFEYLGHRLELGAVRPWEIPWLGPTLLRGGYRLRLDDYANPSSRSWTVGSGASGTRRQDVENALAIELAPRLDESAIGLGGVVDRLELTIGLIGAVRTSNLSAFEYNRVIGSIGVRAQF